MERFLDRTLENLRTVPGAVRYALRREAISQALYYASIPLGVASFFQSFETGLINERLVQVQEMPTLVRYYENGSEIRADEVLDHKRKQSWVLAAAFAAAGTASLLGSRHLRRNL
jgi:hypothetical protein